MVEQPKRETAKICTVNHLLTGEYVVQDGLLPNYILSNNRKLSRVNIIGIVVSKPTPYDFLLDDGTGTILVSDFNQSKAMEKISLGQPVLVIGRPRKTSEDIFLACEIATSKQLQQESGWIQLRKQELQLFTNVVAEKNEEPVVEKDELQVVVEDVVDEETTPAPEEKSEPVKVESVGLSPDEIITFIRKKDGGSGCSIEDILSYFGDDAESIVLSLITMGEIFEIKPGQVKVLE